MANFLFLSRDGAGLPLALKIAQAGHPVKVWIEQEAHKRQFDGMIDKVDEWADGLEADSIVVFDSVAIGVPESTQPKSASAWESYHPLSEQLRAQGYLIVGGGKTADRMELDRSWGAELAKKAGLLVPKTYTFSDLSKASDFVRQTKQRYILKPHGNQATFKNYPAQGWEDMVQWLDHLKDKGEFETIEVELQEFIGGQQMSIEGWWTGQTFVGLNSTFEYKPMLHGDLGPYTGETGSIIFYYTERNTKLDRDVLRKLEPVLRDLDYPHGPLDVNCIVNEEGAWFLEFTARFGYPALYAQLSAVEDDWGVVMEQVAKGTFKGFTPKKAYWDSVARVWVPKWPYDEIEESLIDAPLFSRITDAHLDQIHFVDVYLNGQVRVLGTDGELMAVTAQGNSLRETTAKMYQLIHDILLYPMGYRDDIGENLRLEALQRWGYWLPCDQ